MALQLFGWQLIRPDEIPEQPAIAPPQEDDGALVIDQPSLGGYYGTYLNLDTAFRNENELISRYRTMAMQPEIDSAIDEIVNEAIVHDEFGKVVEIVLDELPESDDIKELLREEFRQVLRLLDFSNSGSDIFRRWYIDGRVFYQATLSEENPRLGIQSLIYLDPRKIRKVRTNLKEKDPRTGIQVVSDTQEFYVYNDKEISQGNMVMSSPLDASIKIAPDSIININSGLMDVSRNMVLSYLHKAIKPLNQLRMIEDAIVIYRLSRAPERRVFYIDIGNLPKTKADQYLRDIMTKFRNKIVYDSNTGEVRDDRRFMSMVEDFWIPRRGEGKSTEITTLPAGQNLGELADVEYFENKLYKSLNVPITRLVPNQPFNVGRSNEITRDEIKFSKFVEKLRNRFSTIFDEIMCRQLVLKGIATEQEWLELREYIHYDFLEDNNYAELKQAELLNNRLLTMNTIMPFIGSYYSMNWAKRNVLHLTEDEIIKMKEEILQEQEEQIAMDQYMTSLLPPEEQAAMMAQGGQQQQGGQQNINSGGQQNPQGNQ